MDQAIGSKIADYLLKPVNPKQILLTLKKNIHQREIVQEVTQTGYRQDFSRIGMQMSESLSPEEWKELYKRLVHWELELAEAGSPMDDMLHMQKEEANHTFAKFIRKNYEGWIQQSDTRPLMSPDIFKRCIFPRLSAGRKVFLLVLDNFRYDQWRMLSRELADDFDMDEDLYYAILPTATQYARNAILQGSCRCKSSRCIPNCGWKKMKMRERISTKRHSFAISWSDSAAARHLVIIKSTIRRPPTDCFHNSRR